MSHKVVYTLRNGTTETKVFPKLSIANNYALGVKGKVVEGGSDDDFVVKKLGTQAEEDAKRERLPEVVDAKKNMNKMHARSQTLHSVAHDQEEEENDGMLCACGKRCSPGMSSCYSCVRYE